MSTILVIDDDPDICGLVEFKLSHAGMEVFSESNAETGLAVAEELLPDLVLVDWMMPRLTGIEVCRRLRAGPRTAGISLVLLTAKALDADVLFGMAAGANDYIVKPFSPRELVVRVEILLEIASCALGAADDLLERRNRCDGSNRGPHHSARR